MFIRGPTLTCSCLSRVYRQQNTKLIFSFSLVCLWLKKKKKYIPHILLSSCDILRTLSLSLALSPATAVPIIDYLFRSTSKLGFRDGADIAKKLKKNTLVKIKEEGFRTYYIFHKTGSLRLLKDSSVGVFDPFYFYFLEGSSLVFNLKSTFIVRVTHTFTDWHSAWWSCFAHSGSVCLYTSVSVLTLNRWSQQRQKLHPRVLPHASCRRVYTWAIVSQGKAVRSLR